MYEIMEIIGNDFKSVVAIDKLSIAIYEKHYLMKQNPGKEYVILDEKGLKI